MPFISTTGWKELDVNNYPEHNKWTGCQHCGAKNRTDEGWRYNDSPAAIAFNAAILAQLTPMELRLIEQGQMPDLAKYVYECDQCRTDKN